MLVLGFVLMALGIGSALLAISRWKVAGVTLLSFGGFSALYGARLLAGSEWLALVTGMPDALRLYAIAIITYVVLVPATVFFNELLGPGWLSLLRRLWPVALVFAIVAIGVDLGTGRPAASMALNGYLVIGISLVGMANLFRRGLAPLRETRILRGGFGVFALLALNDNLVAAGLLPWRTRVETPGFVVLIACVVTVVAQRVFAAQERLAAVTQELATARRIQTSILPRAVPKLPGLEVAVRYQPMTAVAGDFYDFLFVDASRVGILVADVSGHGVPAALVASMVKVAFAAQAGHAAHPPAVLAGLNRILCGSLDGQFVTAIYAYLDLEARRLAVGRAGHPPALLWRRAVGQCQEIGQPGLLLGVVPSADYEATEVGLAPGDRLVLYTDGVTEAMRPSGEMLEVDGLRSFVVANAAVPGEPFMDALLAHLTAWSGPRQEGFADDVTVAVLDLVRPASA